MGGAIVVGLAAFRFAGGRTRALLGGPMRLPTASRIDRRLVLGGLAFGIGWGLAGYCPGPALASLASGGAKPLIFGAAMVAGMAIFELLERRAAARARAGMTLDRCAMRRLALGLVVGVILALTGAGGGILAVPLLVFGAA